MIRDIFDEPFWGLWECPVPGRKLHITDLIQLIDGSPVRTTICQKGSDGDTVPWVFVLEQYRKAPKATLKEIEKYVCKRCMQGFDLKTGTVRIFRPKPRSSKNVAMFRKISGSRDETSST